MERPPMFDIQWDHLSRRFRLDPIFRDYFNKFLCLPVFGQKLAYILSKGTFIFDPPPLRSGVKRAKISNELVWIWALNQRLTYFRRSSAWSEYSLCRQLLNTPYWNENEYETQADVVNGLHELDQLKGKSLQKVSQFIKFSKMMENTKYDHDLIRFWIEADRLAIGDDSEKADKLRAIQRKYYPSTSKNRLPAALLDAVYPDRKNDSTAFDHARTLRLKQLVFERLHSYWFPKFVLKSRNDIDPKTKTKLKKIAAAWGHMEAKKKRDWPLIKSKLVRLIPDPEVLWKDDPLFQGPHIELPLEAEEEDNFLIQQESEREIWGEEQYSSRTDVHRHGSEMLGSENIKYIHEHIFGKDYSRYEESDAVSKVTGSSLAVHVQELQLLRETYELFPGRKVIVKRDSESEIDLHEKAFSTPDSIESPPGGFAKHQEAEESRRLCEVEATRSEGAMPEVNPELANLPGVKSLLAHIDVELEENVVNRFRRRASVSQSIITQPYAKEKTFADSATTPTSAVSEPPKRSKSDMTVPKSPKKRSRASRRSTNSSSKPCSNVSSCSLPPLSPDSSSRITTETPATSRTQTTTIRAPSLPGSRASGDRSFSPSTRLSSVEQGDVLRGVELGAIFSEVLASDEQAGFPFRCYLLSCPDGGKRRSSPSLADAPSMLSQAYDLWRHLDDLKRTYFKLNSGELRQKLTYLVHVLFGAEILKRSDIMSVVSLFNFLPESPFPDGLVQFQRSLETVLEPHWVRFASADQMEFKYVAITTEQRYFPHRHSFPSLPGEMRAQPILRERMEDIDEYMESEEELSCGYLATLGYGGEGHIRYRTSRAFRMLMTSSGNDVYQHERYSDLMGDDSSDEEGGLPPLRPKLYVKLPELDARTIAQHSASEYPRQGIDYGLYKALRMVQRFNVDQRPIYLRPIRKRGVILTRPLERPKHLIDVLRDPLHFEFFKRYMKMHKSEAPLLFWKAVELLRRTDSSLTRQKKAQQILKKFFGRLAGGGMMLQCDSDVIREIATVETVTTSMLIQASTEVMKSMEKNWAARYFSTFAEPDYQDSDFDSDDGRLGMRAFKTKLRHVWEVFCEFMRRAARFIVCMRNPDTFANFTEFLNSLVTNTERKPIAAGDASSTAVAFTRHQTQVYKHLDTDLIYKYTTRKVLGRKVTLDFLANDLAFWIDADRYIAMWDNVQQMILAGCYVEGDNDLVREKAQRTVACYLDSHIPPKTRVNLDPKIVDVIVENVREGVNERGIFHEAILVSFPLLLHYWRIYRHNKFRYVARRVLRAQHRAEVKERAILIKKQKLKQKRRKAKLKQKVHFSNTSLDSSEDVRPSTSGEKFPDYVNGLSKKKDPYEKVKGLLHNDPPTIHFTLQHGLKLILPPRRRLVDRFGELENNEMPFMDVWTRGAKVVQVFREGSDPKLLDLAERKKGFRVKCDLVDR